MHWSPAVMQPFQAMSLLLLLRELLCMVRSFPGLLLLCCLCYWLCALCAPVCASDRWWSPDSRGHSSRLQCQKRDHCSARCRTAALLPSRSTQLHCRPHEDGKAGI